MRAGESGIESVDMMMVVGVGVHRGLMTVGGGGEGGLVLKGGC